MLYRLDPRSWQGFCRGHNSQRQLPSGLQPEPDQWYSLTFEWDLQRRQCRLLIDTQQAALLPLLNKDSLGVGYLRLRLAAETTDKAGLFVEWVHVGLDKPEVDH